MGRHSAPDDEDAALDDQSSDARQASSVATAPRGRHAREDEPRPRPTPGPDPSDPPTSDPPTADPPTQGFAFLEEAFDAPPAARPTAGAEPVVGTDAPAAAPAAQRPERVAGAHATKHDLALVMSHGDVRARALAAVVVPFAGYVAVLAIIGALTVHSLVWLWAPAIVAGVLVGLVLDAGHRRYPAPPTDAVSEPAARSS